MAKIFKKDPSTNLSPFHEILETIGNVGSAVAIANAIKSHTRAMVAMEYCKQNSLYLKSDFVIQTAWDFADKFLAAGKKPDTPTEKTDGE